MATSGEFTGAAAPPAPSSSPPSILSPGILMENEDRSTSTIEFGRREELRGLGEELIRLDYHGRWDLYGEEAYMWSYEFAQLVADADPDLHDTLHPYHDLALLAIHGEKLLDIAIRLASPQQWLKWIRTVANVAASTGTSGVFLRLLASWGGPVDDKTLSTLLSFAAEGGSVDILSALIAAGAGPLVRMVGEVGRRSTALEIAAKRGYQTFVAKLIEAGAPVEEKPVNGSTALMLAVRCRHKGVVLELLAAGADVNAMKASFRQWAPGTSAPCNFNPLHIAVETRDEEIVNILLEAGAEPSKEAMDVLPLHTAARQGSCQIMNSLLLAGARVDTVDTTGCSALHLACAYSQPEAVDILLRHNASVALMSNGGLSPMDVVGAQVLALRQWSKLRPGTIAPTRPTAPRELERELLERCVDLYRLRIGFGPWMYIAHPSTLNSAETSTVDTICDMLQPFIAWSRRGWLVMMRSRHLAEIVAEQPDFSDEDSFALSVRDIVLDKDPSSNRAGLHGKRRAAQPLHDVEHATTDWSAAVTWLLRSPDDSLFRSIGRFL